MPKRKIIPKRIFYSTEEMPPYETGIEGYEQ